MLRDYIRRAYRTLWPLLYGRSRFKLFLNASFGEIDLRVQQLASLTDYFSAFVKPVPICAPFGDSMLVIAPHQDDEAIGCGGALALQARTGRRAVTVVLQDGAGEWQESGTTRAGLAELRNEESRQAAAELGIEAPVCLNYASLPESREAAVREIRRIIEERRVDAVFVPYLLDGNPDHRTAAYILADALKTVAREVRVLGYEVWGFAVPNVIVAIDEVMEQKLRMISCFRYASQALDYANSTKGANMYRSRLLPAGACRYAECFFEAPRLEFIELAAAAERAEGRTRTGHVS